MKPKKFRKRPVVIEAQQWWPPGDTRHEPLMLSHRKGNTVDPPDYLRLGDLRLGDLFQFSRIVGMGHDVFFIKTLEGDMKVSPGDWIITGVKGEKYACKPDIFEMTYEEVVE